MKANYLKSLPAGTNRAAVLKEARNWIQDHWHVPAKLTNNEVLSIVDYRFAGGLPRFIWVHEANIRGRA